MFKKVNLIISASLVTATMLVNCAGNSENSITIGNQIWMTKNLDVSNFRNGDPIPEAKTHEEWEKAGEEGRPIWCYQKAEKWIDGTNHTQIIKSKYGKLYNFYAVTDSRGLAPDGWSVPNEKDWDNLIVFLGGYEMAGEKMKANDQMDWIGDGPFNSNQPETPDQGSNDSRFSAYPHGSIKPSGGSRDLGEFGYYWSSTEKNNNAMVFIFEAYSGRIGAKEYDKSRGCSIRCIKK